MEIRRTGIDLIQTTGTAVPESAPEQIAQQTATESNQKPLSESTITARKSEFAMAGMLQQSLLNSQFISANRPAAPVTETSVPAPDAEGINFATRELKLGDQGVDVINLQAELIQWRREHGLPPLEQTFIYDAATEEAVKDFQRANNMSPTGKASAGLQDFVQLECNAEFKHLNGDVKDIIRQDMTILENDPTARQRLMTLAQDRTFGRLISSDAQKSAINAFMSNTGSAKHFKGIQDTILDVAILDREQRLDKLPAETKRKVIDTLFTKTGEFDNRYREDIINLATDPKFGTLTEQQQSDLMNGIALTKLRQTPIFFESIIQAKGFQDASPEVKDRIIFLASRGAVLANEEEANSTLANIYELIKSEQFYTASEEDQNILLKQFRQNKSDEYL